MLYGNNRIFTHAHTHTQWSALQKSNGDFKQMSRWNYSSLFLAWNPGKYRTPLKFPFLFSLSLSVLLIFNNWLFLNKNQTSLSFNIDTSRKVPAFGFYQSVKLVTSNTVTISHGSWVTSMSDNHKSKDSNKYPHLSEEGTVLMICFSAQCLQELHPYWATPYSFCPVPGVSASADGSAPFMLWCNVCGGWDGGFVCRKIQPLCKRPVFMPDHQWPFFLTETLTFAQPWKRNSAPLCGCSASEVVDWRNTFLSMWYIDLFTLFCNLCMHNMDFLVTDN